MCKTKFHMTAMLLAVTLFLTAFTVPALAMGGPEDAPSGISIIITPPTGWTNRDANAAITITDLTGNGFERALVKADGDRNWRDITSELDRQDGRYDALLTVSDNGSVTVSVTGWDGKTYEESRYIGCFDRAAPTLRASFTAQQLHVEATDAASGVAAVLVNGRRYTALTNGAVDIPLTEIGTNVQKITVQAEDNAGNVSQAVSLDNPGFKTAGNVPDGQTGDASKPTQATTTSKPTASTTTTVTTTKPTQGGDTPGGDPATNQEGGSSGKPLTPDGNLTLVDDIGGAAQEEKQFVTVVTKNGNYFYLIIDRADDGEETVHFLNQVDEADLLALMEDGTVTPAVCSCADKCRAGAVNTACQLCAVDMTECVGKEPEPEPDPGADPEPEPEPDPKKGGKNTVVAVVLAVALAGCGAVYFLKFKKAKHDTKGSADLDDYDYGDEDEPEEEAEDE